MASSSIAKRILQWRHRALGNWLGCKWDIRFRNGTRQPWICTSWSQSKERYARSKLWVVVIEGNPNALTISQQLIECIDLQNRRSWQDSVHAHSVVIQHLTIVQSKRLFPAIKLHSKSKERNHSYLNEPRSLVYSKVKKVGTDPYIPERTAMNFEEMSSSMLSSKIEFQSGMVLCPSLLGR